MGDLDEWFPNGGFEAPKGSQDKTEKSHDENLLYKIQMITLNASRNPSNSHKL